MNESAKTVAIIPARGGSKGIPQKNVRILSGKPLIAWNIEAAAAAATVDRVVVSTDDDEIARVAREYGADVVMRPQKLAGDTASSESALLHVLATLQAEEGYSPSVLAFLQCTSPLTTAEDIDGTVGLVAEGGYDTALTVTPFHYFIWQENDNGDMIGVNHEATRRLMRQQRTPEYMEVGAVYAMRVEGFQQHQFRFFGRIGRYAIPTSRAVEIDELADWAVAEALMQTTGRTLATPVSTARLATVQAIVTDFDGVLTDNRVHVDEDRKETVVCSRADGWGIRLLKEAGLLVACISTEENPVVAARCAKLDIPYWQGQRDKRATLQAFLASEGIPAASCLYVGNDTNDLACLQYAGIAVVPGDAQPEAKAEADWQTVARGGDGVLREIARIVLQAKTAS